MRLVRQLIALLLVAATLCTFVPVSAAETDNSSGSAPDTRFEGTNSFGTMLAQELSATDAEEDPSWISNIAFENNVATIDAAFGCSATVLLGIYDEDTGEMVTSATIDVTAEDITATVTVPNLPESFLIEAFVVDSVTYEPLCGAYSSTYYTSAMQQLQKMTVSDFESDRVLQLTDETETNFAVYSDGVLVVRETQKENHLSVNGSTYIFTNVDSNLREAKKGDILAYHPLKGDIIILKIRSLTNMISTLFITGETPQAAQVFDYVKVNSAATLDNAAVQNVGEGVEFYGVSYPNAGTQSTRSYDKYSASAQFNFGLKDFQLGDNLSLTAMLGITLGVELEYYLALGEDSYVRLELFYETKVEFGIEGKIKLRKIRLAEVIIPIVPSLNAVVTFNFVFKASAKLSHTTTQRGSMGLIASTTGGRFRVQKISAKPVSEQKVSLEGKVFLGLEFEVGITVINEYLAKIATSLTAGLEITGKLVGQAMYPGSNHSCNLCIDGDVKFVLKIGTSLDLISLFHYQGTLLKWERHLGDIWFSFDLADGGYGSCPNDLDATSSLVQGQTALRNGQCGENLWWTLYANGALEISGEGKMYDWYYNSSVPWEDYRDQIVYAIVNDGCENLANFTFYNCTNLEYVQLPQTVTEVGEYCFAYCESLLDIELPEGVTSLGQYAFYYCEDLEAIYLGEDLESMGQRAFAGCSALEEALLPVGFETMGQFAFDGCESLTYVEFPPTIVEIGNSAFLDCIALESAELPDSLTTLGKSAFSGCTSLAYARLGSGIEKMGSSAFADCTALTELEIKDGVAEIGANAFWDCTGLRTLTIPGSVKTIGSYAFVSCENLRILTLHEGIESIMGWVFQDCDSLTTVDIPDSVKEIGNYAFRDCDKLTVVNFGSGLELISVGAFRDCPKLSSVVLPEGLTEMGDEVFSNCPSVTSATLGGELERIGSSAFSDCIALTELTIRPGTQIVGASAFWGCESLTSVQLPDSIVELEGYAFVACTGLAHIDLGTGLQIINGSSLKNTALTTLEIPAGVTYVGGAAFGNNDLLTSVYFLGDAPEFQRTSFEDTTTTVYYPSNRNGWTSEVFQDYGGSLTWVAYTVSDATSVPAEALAFAPTLSGTRSVTLVDENVHGLDSSARYLLVVAHSNKEPLLDRSNLIYANQYLSDHTGSLTVDWPQVENAYVALYGKDGVTILAIPTVDDDPIDPPVDDDPVDPPVDDDPVDPPTPPSPVEPDCDGGANCPSSKFRDVKTSDWFHEYIDFAVANGLFGGMSATTFEPETEMTRAMLVTVLWRYAGQPIQGENTFKDVPGDQWYTKAVAWAAANGVVTGTGSNRFDPDGNITREQMAAILFRYANANGIDTSARSALTAFPDGSRVSAYAVDAMQWAVATGLINGSGGKLLPQGNATRAQVAAILMRYILKSGGESAATHRYELVISNCSWTEAQAEAIARGGYLVNFNSLGEYTSVLAKIEALGYQNVYFRIGGRRDAGGREYYWVDAEGTLYGECLNRQGAWCYDLWLQGEPNFEWEGTQEAFMEICYSDEAKSWVWNDVSDQMTYPKEPERCGYIIEFDTP